MNDLKNIDCFWDTLERCTEGSLGEKCEISKKTAKVYGENFTAQSRPQGLGGRVIVEENTTFGAAEKYFVPGKTAVLDFANPIVPGGGVKNGANAQEECLCRQSSLYPCISNSRMSMDFYDYHRGLGTVLYSDRLIYARDITVIKDDDLVLLDNEKQFDVDVIVSAAPYNAASGKIPNGELEKIFIGRIKNIFEAAIDGGTEVLILGAFGCGAFRNPPEVVARAFRRVIEDNNYTDCFGKIVFAIKSSVRHGVCPNLAAFENEFSDFSADNNVSKPPVEVSKPKITQPKAEFVPPIAAHEPEFSLPQEESEPPVEVSEPEITQPKIEFVPPTAAHEPEFSLPQDESEPPVEVSEPEITQPKVEFVPPTAAHEPELSLPQEEPEPPVEASEPEIAESKSTASRFEGKNFSVFGDSISTLFGCIPNGYSDFYEGAVASLSGVKTPEDTWWKQVIDRFGGSLLVNNSWSGCKVTKLPENDGLFPSACSNERTGGLHRGECKPDVIMIYLGFNDWAFGVPLTPKKDENGFYGFDFAYENMLRKIKNNYPDAEIWCCTLCGTKMSGNPNFSFPFVYNGKHINMFNNVIRNKAKTLGCTVVDIAAENILCDSIDGTHPNVAGMKTLSSLVIKNIEKIYGKEEAEPKPEPVEPEPVEPESVESELIEPESLEPEPTEPEPIKPEQVKPEQEKPESVKPEQAEHKDIYSNRSHKIKTTFEKFCSDLKEQKSIDGFTLEKVIYDKSFRVMFDVRDAHGAQYVLNVFNKRGAFYKNMSAPDPRNFEHPVVQKYIPVKNADEYLAAAAEKIPGVGIAQLIKTKGAASEDYAVWLGMRIVNALKFLYSCKPSCSAGHFTPHNVVVTPKGDVKFVFDGWLDYLFIDPDKAEPRPGAANSVKGYAPPEAYGSEGKTTEKSDVYCLGAMLYALVTGIDLGAPPYPSMVPVRKVNPRLSPELEQIILGCTAAKPENRIQSCAELSKQLNALAQLNARRRGQRPR